MIENIRGAFNELLNEVTWMDDVTRKVAKEKVGNYIDYLDYVEKLKLSTWCVCTSYEARTKTIDRYQRYQNIMLEEFQFDKSSTRKKELRSS